MILLIDDEREAMKFYVKALRMKNYEVCQCQSPDEVDTYEKDGHEAPALIVLDVMLPPGKFEDNPECDDGMRTGLLLYPELRARWPNAIILVLTNVMNPQIMSLLHQLVSDEFILKKEDTPPFRLADIVIKLLCGRN